MSFTKNLEQSSLIRHEIANYLEEMTAMLTAAETKGDRTSGRLSLSAEIKQLEVTSSNLRHNKFKSNRSL